MKIMTTIVLLFVCVICSAPALNVAFVAQGEAIKKDMILAFMEVESGFRSDAHGRLDDEGILQIRPVMIREVNRICEILNDPRRFRLSDRLDSTKSAEIWYIVQSYWNPDYDIRVAAKIWNPTAGPDYLAKVRRCL